MGLCHTKCVKCHISLETHDALNPCGEHHCRVHNYEYINGKIICKDCQQNPNGSNCLHRWKFFLC